MTNNGFCELNTSDWFPYVWALPQNRWRLRLHILKYANRVSCIFSIATALLSPFFFRPLAKLFFNVAMRIRSLFSKSASVLRLVEQAFWRMPFFTEWIVVSSFSVIVAEQWKHSTTGAVASGTSGSPRNSLILLRRRTRRRIRLCHFCTLINIVTETAIVSFEHCPSAFHCQHSPRVLCSRCFVTWFLITAFFSKFPFLASNSCFVNLVRYLFLPSSWICDYQVQLSSGESPYCTIPIRSWVSQTLVFLICTILPRCHQMGFSSLII